MKTRPHSLIAALVGFAASPAFSATYYWDNDGATAGFGTAAGTWAAPTTGNATQGWSEDSAGTTEPVDVTTTTSDDVFFGTGVGLGSGTVTVSGSVDVKSATFGSASGAITLSGGTIALGGTNPFMRFNNTGNTISSALTLDANTSILMGSSTALLLNLNGAIGGTGNLTFTTPNTSFNNANQVITLGAASNYSGNTLITTANINNRLRVNSTVANALPTTTVLTLDGGNGTGTGGRTLIFDMNGNNQTVAGLASVARTLRNQQVLNTGSATTTLTINNPNNHTWRANIAGTGIGVVKQGIGTQTFTGTNGYNGPTSITAGKLVGVVGGHCRNSELRLDDAEATAGVSVTDNTLSWKWGALAANASGTLEFNFGAVTPSTSVSPLEITDENTGTGEADFTAATPAVSVVVDSPLLPGTYPLMTWTTLSGTPPTTDDLTVSQIASGTVASLEVDGNTLNLVITSTITSIVKADNTNNLNLGSSWVGGTAPASGDIAKWNSTVTSANTTILGTDLTWSGIVIENPTGLVTIEAGNTLTLDGPAIDIDLSSAHTADLTLNCGLALGDANIWDVATGRTLTISGAVSGDFPLTMQGAGTVRLGAGDVLPDGSGNGNLTVDGNLDLNGNSETLNGLSGNGVIDTTATSSAATLTVGGNDQSSTFNGVLQNTGASATLNLVKTGTGVQVFGGANTLDGTISITGGTLALNNTAPFDGASGISMDDGTMLRPVLADAVIYAPVSITGTGSTVTITGHSIPLSTGTTNFPFSLEGSISGDGNVVFAGVETTNDYSVINLNAASNYTGSTLITTLNGVVSGAPNNANIFFRIGVEDALPTTTVLTLDGGDGGGSAPGRFCEFSLNGNNQTVAGLTNVTGLASRVQRVVNTSATDATLTVNNTANFEYSAQLGWVSGFGSAAYNNFGLTKTGAGILTLSGISTYTGATTITGGTLALGASNVLADVTEVIIGDATLSIGAGFLDIVDRLDVTGAATINLGSGATLSFADKGDLLDWSGTLTITGNFVSGSSLQFGTDASGLTAEQLAKISGPGLSDIALNSEGFLTATVAASGYTTWAAINAGGQGPELDFDFDGVSNGVEFFLNAPAGFTANPALDGSNTITWANGGNIPASAYGTQFIVQTSGNLVDWTDVTVGELTSNTDGPGGSLTYALTGTAPRFVRLMVTPE
jgi:autotransporter-associated beta strand protein